MTLVVTAIEEVGPEPPPKHWWPDPLELPDFLRRRFDLPAFLPVRSVSPATHLSGPGGPRPRPRSPRHAGGADQ